MVNAKLTILQSHFVMIASVKCADLTWEMNGATLFFSVSILPSEFSMMDGKDRSRRVCPVGAVSNTTTEKSILFTSLIFCERKMN